MNTLTLDKSDPEIAKALEGCKIGVPKTLTLTVVPTEDTDTVFTADVTGVEYAEEEVEESPEDVARREAADKVSNRLASKMPKAIVMIGMPGKKAA